MFLEKTAGKQRQNNHVWLFLFYEPTADYDFYGGRRLSAEISLQKTAKTASRAVGFRGCRPA